MGAKEVAVMLNMPVNKVVAMANRLKLGKKRERWTKEKIEILKDRYKKDGPKIIAKDLGLTKAAVIAKAKKLGLTKTLKRWTKEEELFLQQELEKGLSHESIGLLLNKSKSSIMHKAQRLGISKPNTSWEHIPDEELLALVKKYQTAEEFDTNPCLPSYKTLIRRFGVCKWNDIKELAGISTAKTTGRYDFTKPAVFYIIQFEDTDSTVFNKYGVTQRSIKVRYRKNKQYNILYEELCSLQEALNKEIELSKCTIPYIPLSLDFTYKGHSGYTECFSDYIRKPHWIDRG